MTAAVFGTILGVTLVWAVDGGDAVAYAYDRDAYDGAYKLWKSDVDDNPGLRTTWGWVQ